MYQILYAPQDEIPGVTNSAFYDWAVWDEYPTILDACKDLASEITYDIKNGEHFAYQIVEKRE